MRNILNDISQDILKAWLPVSFLNSALSMVMGVGAKGARATMHPPPPFHPLHILAKSFS